MIGLKTQQMGVKCFSLPYLGHIFMNFCFIVAVNGQKLPDSDSVKNIVHFHYDYIVCILIMSVTPGNIGK